MAATVAPARGRTEAMEALGHAFKGALAAVRRLQGRDTHRPGALSHAQYQVLFELARVGPMAAGELATLSDVSPASMTQMLDRLADAGLVERIRSERDRRIVMSSLSEAGQAVCEARRASIEPLWRATLDEFTVVELNAAAAVLGRLSEMFEQLGGSAADGAGE